MPLVVETGTGNAGADSYISVSDFTARNTLRGVSLTGDNGTAEQILLIAMDYIESLDYIGYKKTQSQALQWPRTDVFIDGFEFADTSIPKEIINAQCEVAIAIDAGNSPIADLGRETKREKVGDIEVEYMDNAKSEIVRRSIDVHLKKILMSGFSGIGVVSLVRG
jgi:hypothetical protein